jgi:hypothetical protein
MKTLPPGTVFATSKTGEYGFLYPNLDHTQITTGEIHVEPTTVSAKCVQKDLGYMPILVSKTSTVPSSVISRVLWIKEIDAQHIFRKQD